MVLYEVKVPGLRSALNLREISHLYRAGQLQARTQCKPKGATAWSTIGELFPLMEPTTTTYVLPIEISPAIARFRRAVGGMMLLALLATGTYFVRGKFSHDSAAVTPATANLQGVSETISLVNEKPAR
jgi:hypothetical protein